MSIAKDERIATHVSHLPASWGTLYELTKLKDEQFQQAVQNGAINPGMERADVGQLRPAKIIDLAHEDISQPTSPSATEEIIRDVGGGGLPAVIAE